MGTSTLEQEARSELAKMPGAEITVTDQQSYAAAGELLRDIATIKKEIKAKFADPKKKAAEAHKAICSLENEMLAKVTERENEIRRKMVAYYEAEQARIAAEQERKRIEAEELARLAVEAESKGDVAFAAEAVATAAITEATVTYAPQASGISMRKTWKAIVTDKSRVPMEYLEVNMVALNALAKATKGKVRIPGVEFVEETVSSVRSK